MLLSIATHSTHKSLILATSQAAERSGLLFSLSTPRRFFAHNFTLFTGYGPSAGGVKDNYGGFNEDTTASSQR